MKILIASDHAGFELKQKIIAHFSNLSWEDLGPTSDSRVDYPDFAEKLCKQIPPLKADAEPDIFGILVCGSGQGMAMKANKFSHIRAALCWDEASTTLSRQHNNANVLCLGGRILPLELSLKLVDLFLKTPFEGGRHGDRVLKLSQ